MSSILDIINIPIGYLFKWLYLLVNDYGIAILLVAVVTKVLMLPLGIKQHKGTLSQLKFRPRLNEIQTKYKDNPERMRREMAKLQEEGYSPAAGCSTLLIQFPILIGIYNVIRHPLTYIIGMNSGIKDSLLVKLQELAPGIFSNLKLTSTDFEIKALSYIQNNSSSFSDMFSPDKLSLIEKFRLNFLGINSLDLAQVPEKWKNILGIIPIPSFTTVLVLIPILSGLTALAAQLLTQKIGVQAYMQDETTKQSAGTMKFMMFFSCYMSYAIAMSVPAGLGLYWIFSNILMIVQTIAINKIYSPEAYIEQMQKEAEALKAKRKRAQQRIAEERRLENAQAKKNKSGNKADKEDIPGDKE